MADTKILVVDDEKDSIVFVEAILEDEGYTVISAGDGPKVLKKPIRKFLI